MASRRQRRVAEQIHHELARMLLFDAKDKRLASVEVTGLRLTPDLQLAHVFYRTLSDDLSAEDALKLLGKAASFFRREMGKRLHLRYSPRYEFHFDESLERGAHIDQVLQDLRERGEMGGDEATDGAE